MSRVVATTRAGHHPVLGSVLTYLTAPPPCSLVGGPGCTYYLPRVVRQAVVMDRRRPPPPPRRILGRRINTEAIAPIPPNLQPRQLSERYCLGDWSLYIIRCELFSRLRECQNFNCGRGLRRDIWIACVVPLWSKIDRNRRDFSPVLADNADPTGVVASLPEVSPAGEKPF